MTLDETRDEWYEAITDGLVCLLLEMGQEEVGNRLRVAHETFKKACKEPHPRYHLPAGSACGSPGTLCPTEEGGLRVRCVACEHVVAVALDD